MPLFQRRTDIIVQIAGMLDDHPLYSRIDRLERIGQLRNHSIGNDALLFQLLETAAGDFADNAPVIILVIQHSVLFKAVYQLGLMREPAVIAAMSTFLAAAAYLTRRTISVVCHCDCYG